MWLFSTFYWAKGRHIIGVSMAANDGRIKLHHGRGEDAGYKNIRDCDNPKLSDKDGKTPLQNEIKL